MFCRLRGNRAKWNSILLFYFYKETTVTSCFYFILHQKFKQHLLIISMYFYIKNCLAFYSLVVLDVDFDLPRLSSCGYVILLTH